MKNALLQTRQIARSLFQSYARFKAWRAIEHRLRRSRYALHPLSDRPLRDAGPQRAKSTFDARPL